MNDLLVVVELLQLGLFDLVEENGDFIRVEFTDHVCLLTTVALHRTNFIINYTH